jgi:hypothetical protein
VAARHQTTAPQAATSRDLLLATDCGANNEDLGDLKLFFSNLI